MTHYNTNIIKGRTNKNVLDLFNGTVQCSHSIFHRFSIFRYNLVIVNQSLVEKYGTHEAAFYMLINDQVIKMLNNNNECGSLSN